VITDSGDRDHATTAQIAATLSAGAVGCVGSPLTRAFSGGRVRPLLKHSLTTSATARRIG
jgi:hypothetical protein